MIPTRGTGEPNLSCDDFRIRTSTGFETEPLSLRLDPGEARAVVGRAGAGKSLVFEAFSDIHRPGVEASGTLSRGAFAHVPQDARLVALPTDRVWSLVGLSGLRVALESLTGADRPPRESEDRARSLMLALRLDPTRIAELAYRDLSMTERRAILLCRALLQEPQVLLFDGWDEMTDGWTRRATASLLEEQMRAGMSVLLASRRFPLRDFPKTSLISLSASDGTHESAVPLLKRPEPQEPHERPLLELNRLRVAKKRLGLVKRRPPALPVDGANLFVRHGETLVLLGAAGSGKTTLLQAISGLEAPSSGTIVVDGHDVTHARGRRARRLRRDVQLVFQDATAVLDGNRTVAAHLLEAQSLGGDRSHSPAAWLERLGLSPRLLRAPADQLSASESQRIDLARSLIVSPRLVLFDAPEVSGAESDGGLIASVLASEKANGRAFLVASSNPEIAKSLADRIAILHAGRVIELGTRDEVLNRPGHPVTWAMLHGGEVAPSDPTAPCHGCPHTPLCARRQLPQCNEREPMLAPLLHRPDDSESVVPGQHRVACFQPIER